MSTKEFKIPFSYCRIERAARLLGCEVSDLVNLGIMRKISLCLNFFGARSVIFVNGDSASATKWFENLERFPSTSSLMGSSVSEFSRMHLYKYDYDTDSEETTLIPYFSESSTQGCFSSIGRAYGLWRLWAGLEEIENFGWYALGGFELTPCYPNDENIVMQLLLVGETDEGNEDDEESEAAVFKEKITASDLWVTSYDIKRLLGCNGDYSSLSDDSDVINPQAKNNIEIIHHSTERHARNREQILMAAMRFKEEQQNVFNECCRKPDGSINYSAWARELIARPDWFNGGDLPIKTETKIAEILNNAHKRPGER